MASLSVSDAQRDEEMDQLCRSGGADEFCRKLFAATPKTQSRMQEKKAKYYREKDRVDERSSLARSTVKDGIYNGLDVAFEDSDEDFILHNDDDEDQAEEDEADVFDEEVQLPSKKKKTRVSL